MAQQAYQSSMTSWWRLPPELRIMVLEMVVQPYTTHHLYRSFRREWYWERLPQELQTMILDLSGEQIPNPTSDPFPQLHFSVYRAVFEEWKEGRLPEELRMLVLEKLENMKTKRRHLSAYALVCQEWQYYFEQINFERLTLHQSDIPELGRIVQGRRRVFLKKIWLRLELPEYDCQSCRKQESSKEVRSHNLTFTNAIFDLFAILTTWRSGDIILELSAHSPSDSKHFCKELNGRMQHTTLSKIISRYKIPYHDPAHHWHQGRRTHRIKVDAKMRVFGHPNGVKLDLRALSASRMKRTLPKVSVVTGLVIRRRFCRAFSVAKALQPIIRRLAQLRMFCYQPWRGIDTKDYWGQAVRDMEHHLLFLSVFECQKSLRSVSIFEDFNPAFHTAGDQERYPLLGKDLAKSSREFVDLHASLNVDANDFFHAFWPGQDPREREGVEWSNLRRLSLTSYWLNPRDYDQLIQIAALAAQRMPQLQVMELWNSGESHACIFRYEGRISQPRVQLLSTWGAQLGAQAKTNWGIVAHGHSSHHGLEAEAVNLDADLVNDLSSVIQRLVLKSRVLCASSQRQMLMEADHRWKRASP